MENAELVAGKMSEVQFKFLMDEFKIDEGSFHSLSNDDLDDLYDRVGFIEVDETMDADERGGDLTERGKIAVGIVTLIGNELYRPEQDEFEEDEE